MIHLSVPPGTVDVNVHPTKQEVKFANERAVCDAVYWAVKNALREGADEVRESLSGPQNLAQAQSSTFSAPVFTKDYNQTRFSSGQAAAPLHRPIAPADGLVPPTPFMPNTLAEITLQLEDTEPEPQEDGTYRIAGQLFGTYIVVEADGKMVLIDQHVAHERMIYERLLTARRESRPMSQFLLTPSAVTLSAEEFAALFENLGIFTDLGFEIEEFGNNSVLVRRTPASVGEGEIKHLLTELIERVGRPDTPLTAREEEMLEMIACKAAVKGNNALDEREITALIDDVIKTGGVNTCPHGRPLMVTMTKYELEKMFKRRI